MGLKGSAGNLLYKHNESVSFKVDVLNFKDSIDHCCTFASAAASGLSLFDLVVELEHRLAVLAHIFAQALPQLPLSLCHDTLMCVGYCEVLL